MANQALSEIIKRRQNNWKIDNLYNFFFLNPGDAISTQVLQQEFGVTRGTVTVIFPLGRYTLFCQKVATLKGHCHAIEFQN